MPSTVIQKFEDESITEEMIAVAAKLFSFNYGIWGPQAVAMIGSFAKQGARVKMSPKKLAEQILPAKGENTYVRLLIDSELVGNVFGTRWIHDGRPMLWITQLCVSLIHRNQGIAKKLLEAIGQKEQAVGILSSHPFAIMALVRVFGRGLEDVDLEMTKDQARLVMDTCPVGYVREAKLRGTLFGDNDKDGAVSCANTHFWVDHEEPLNALRLIREKGVVWPLGQLPLGHEFVVLVKAEEN